MAIRSDRIGSGIQRCGSQPHAIAESEVARRTQANRSQENVFRTRVRCGPRRSRLLRSALLSSPRDRTQRISSARRPPAALDANAVAARARVPHHCAQSPSPACPLLRATSSAEGCVRTGRRLWRAARRREECAAPRESALERAVKLLRSTVEWRCTAFYSTLFYARRGRAEGRGADGEVYGNVQQAAAANRIAKWMRVRE